MVIAGLEFKIDWRQRSTIRGAVWVATALVGGIGWFLGKDITEIILLGTAVAGGLGVGVKD